MLSLSARAVTVASCCCSCRKRQRWPDREPCLWLLASAASQSASALDAASPARSVRQLSHGQRHASNRHGRLLYIHSRSRRVSARLAATKHRLRIAPPAAAAVVPPQPVPRAPPSVASRSFAQAQMSEAMANAAGSDHSAPSGRRSHAHSPSPDGDRQSSRSGPLVISSSSSPPSHPSLHLSSSSAARLLLPFTCFPFPSCCLSAPVGVPPCRSSCLRIPAAIEAAVGGQSTSADRQARHCVVLPPAAAGAPTDSACSSSHRQMSSPLSFSLFLSFFVVLSLFVFSFLCSSLAEAAATERSHVRRSQQQP